MIKYAKIINEETGLCDVAIGTNLTFYQSIGMEQLDVEQSEKDNLWYLSEFCPHYTEEEQAEIERKKRIQEIKQNLYELDLKRIRAVCENEIKDEQTHQTWLEYYNGQIATLRTELNTLLN